MAFIRGFALPRAAVRGFLRNPWIVLWNRLIAEIPVYAGERSKGGVEDFLQLGSPFVIRLQLRGGERVREGFFREFCARRIYS